MSVVMDRYDALEEGQEQKLKNFSMLFGVSQFVGALAVVSMAILMGSESLGGGFGGQANPELEFNYHPLFMTIGMIFLFGESILVYRVFRNERKKVTKLMHGVLHSMVIVFSGVALKAVLDSHNYAMPKPYPNWYTLHSWFGITLCVAFLLQYVIGGLVFVFPGGTQDVRARVMALHRPCGLYMFQAASVIAMIGFAEHMAMHHLKDWAFTTVGIMSNLTGIFILAYVLLVSYLVSNEEFKRRPLPEETSLQPLVAD